MVKRKYNHYLRLGSLRGGKAHGSNYSGQCVCLERWSRDQECGPVIITSDSAGFRVSCPSENKGPQVSQ